MYVYIIITLRTCGGHIEVNRSSAEAPGIPSGCSTPPWCFLAPTAAMNVYTIYTMYSNPQKDFQLVNSVNSSWIRDKLNLFDLS